MELTTPDKNGYVPDQQAIGAKFSGVGTSIVYELTGYDYGPTRQWLAIVHNGDFDHRIRPEMLFNERYFSRVPT